MEAGDSAPADVIALARQNPVYYSFYPSLDSLSARLRDDESLRLLAQGMARVTPVLVALTDQRELVQADSAAAKVRESMALPVRASWASSPLSSVLTFRSGPHEMQLGAVSDDVADRFLAALD